MMDSKNARRTGQDFSERRQQVSLSTECSTASFAQLHNPKTSMRD